MYTLIDHGEPKNSTLWIKNYCGYIKKTLKGKHYIVYGIWAYSIFDLVCIIREILLFYRFNIDLCSTKHTNMLKKRTGSGLKRTSPTR